MFVQAFYYWVLRGSDGSDAQVDAQLDAQDKAGSRRNSVWRLDYDPWPELFEAPAANDGRSERNEMLDMSWEDFDNATQVRANCTNQNTPNPVRTHNDRANASIVRVLGGD